MLPKEFAPLTTVQGYFYDWRDNGLFETINFHLLLQACEAAGRDASPSAGVTPSPSSAVGPLRSSNARLTQLVFSCCHAAGLSSERWRYTLAWLNRNHRLAKDFEASIASAKAGVYIALNATADRRISLTYALQSGKAYYNLYD